MPVINFINGAKTYIAAAGLIGMAVYDFSIGNVPAAVANIVAAFGLFSAKQASQRVDAKVDAQAAALARVSGRIS